MIRIETFRSRATRILFMSLLMVQTIQFYAPARSFGQELDAWRHTAVGWERIEQWDDLVFGPRPQLEPLAVANVLQRTWPAAVAATECCLLLAILTAGPKIKKL